VAAEESFYAVDMPGATVYVDTDSFVQAGEVAIFVVQNSAVVPSGWGTQPTRVRRDRNLFGAAEQYQGIRYSVVKKSEV
jgi:hypothetical protein